MPQPAYTVAGLATKMGIERDAAYNLIRFLEAVGLITKTGDVEKTASGKGKGANFYTFDRTRILDWLSRTLPEI